MADPGSFNPIDVFEALRDLDPPARSAWLDAAGLSAGQRSRVERMLGALGRAEGFLANPPTQVRDAWAAAPPPGARPLLGEAGATFGEYRLIGHLASGSFGEVWTAAHRSLDAPGAIPCCLKLLYPDRSDLEDVLREARTMAAIRHENVVAVHKADRAEVGGRWVAYIEMELVGEPGEGDAFRPARSMAAEGAADGRPRFDPLRAAAVMAGVCRGVHAAHVRGTLHRDLKPANVLLPAGSTRAKVTDFGIASHALPAAAARADRGLGTPAYMAPEQATGAATQASDVYGLGATLYFLLAGHAPFADAGTAAGAAGGPSSSPGRVLDLLRGGTAPTPLRDLVPGLPRGLLAVVGKAMAADPDARYASAAAMADDLDACRAGRPTAAEAAGPARRFALWCRRNRVVAGLLAVLLVAAVVTPTAYVHGLRREQARTESQRVAAVAAQQASAAHERAAVAERARAERKVAEGLVLQADALALAGRWIGARAAYGDGAAALAALGLPTFPADAGLEAAERDNPAPLYEWPDVKWPPLAAAWSPDGALVATVGGDKLLRLWDPMTGRLVRDRGGHADTVYSVAFSPDGARVATGSLDRTVKVWDVRGDAPPRTLAGHANVVQAVAFSADGLALASGDGSGDLRVWDARTGDLTFSLRLKGWIHSVAFLDAGRLAVAANGVRLIDLRTRQVTRTLPGGGTVLAVSVDGTRLLSDDDRQAMNLWDTAQWTVVRTLRGHGGYQVTAAAFVAGKTDRAVTAGWDRTARVCDLGKGEEVRSIVAHEGWVLAAAVSPDGRRVVTGGYDRGAPLRLFDLAGAGVKLAGDVRDLSPDGRCALLKSYRGGPLRVVDVETGADLAVLPDSARTSGPARFVGGSAGVVACDGGTSEVRRWDVVPAGTAAAAAATRGAKRPGWLATSPDGRLELACQAGTLVLRDAATGAERWRAAPAFDADSATFAADGRVAAAWYAYAGRLALVDVATGRLTVAEDVARTHKILDVSLSRDGGRVALADGSDTVRVFDGRTLAPVRALESRGRPVGNVVIAPDARWVAGGSDESAATLWDADDGRLVRTYPGRDGAFGLRVSGDGLRLLSATYPPTLIDLARPPRERALRQRMAAARLALADRPDDPAALAALGEWCAFRRADDWAATLLERARAGGAAFPAVELAHAYARLGRHAGAAREYARARDANEAPADYLTLCARAAQAAAGR